MFSNGKTSLELMRCLCSHHGSMGLSSLCLCTGFPFGKHKLEGVAWARIIQISLNLSTKGLLQARFYAGQCVRGTHSKWESQWFFSYPVWTNHVWYEYLSLCFLEEEGFSNSVLNESKTFYCSAFRAALVVSLAVKQQVNHVTRYNPGEARKALEGDPKGRF